MADRRETETTHGITDETLTREVRVASPEAIKAVSDILISKRAIWDRPTTSRIILPDLPRAPEAIARPAKDLPGPSLDHEVASTPVGSSRVKVPDGGPSSSGARGFDHPGANPGKDASPVPDQHAAGAVGGVPTLANQEPSPSSPVASMSIGTTRITSEAMNRAAGVKFSDLRVDSPTSDIALGETRLDPGQAGSRAIDPRSINGGSPRTDLARAQGPASTADRGPAGPSTAIQSSGSSALHREPGGLVSSTRLGGINTPTGDGAEFSFPRAAAGRRPGPPASEDASNGFVKNPLSADFRNLALAVPSHPTDGGAAPMPGGIGNSPAGMSFGQPSSPQGGAAVDLSRTNELLQQLLDAVRKQQPSSLPAGGPSVYPAR